MHKIFDLSLLSRPITFVMVATPLKLADAEVPCCPFLESDDPRCASHFTLTRLSDAFGHCVNRHLGCPLYYRLLREQTPLTTLSLRGQPVAARPLRAAGA